MRYICTTSPRILYRRLLKAYCIISAMVCMYYLLSETNVPTQAVSPSRRLLMNSTNITQEEKVRTVVRNTPNKALGSTVQEFGDVKLTGDMVDYSLARETVEINGNSDEIDSTVDIDNTSLSKVGTFSKGKSNTSKGGYLPSNWKQLLLKQITLYDHDVIRTIQSVQVSYLTALAVSALDSPVWNEIIINGWQRRKFENVTLYCCIGSKFSSRSTPVKRREEWKTPDIKVLLAMRFICPNPWSGDTTIVPNKVGLSLSPSCSDTQYINVEYPRVPERKDAIGFCGKIVYGDYKAERLIEWFEMNKLMGVDHVTLFTYNITNDAMKVLKHYNQQGYLTMKEFDFPLKAVFPRHIGQKYLLAWVDEQVTVYDCISRLRKYKYIGILDVDEFLVPKHAVDVSYTALLERMLKSNPRAAGFTFQTQLFISDWGQTHPNSSMVISKYRNRTKAMWDRRKSIFLTNRVHPQSVWTHGFNSIKPYNRLHIVSTMASVFHYRTCRPQWIKKRECLKGARRFMDNTMQRYASNIQTTVEKNTKLLLT